MNIREYTHEDVKKLHRERGVEQVSHDMPKLKPKALSTTLQEYTPSESMPWNERRIKHAKRRIEFGYHFSEIGQIKNQTPSAFIDRIFEDAINARIPNDPHWMNAYPPFGGSEQEIMQYFQDNFHRYIAYIETWLEYMRWHPFREKMVLFWHNHFVTEIGIYELAPFAARYVNVLRRNWIGNFKDFVHEIGLNQAMLIYLNGNENKRGEPNENYARELLELFTMGVGNYTQQDVTEISRALTGYYVRYDNFEVGFLPFRHDPGEKTIFGRTGTYGYSEVIDLIFEERAQEIADFICTKLYKFFVFEVPNPQIIQGLAQTFIESDWELEPVLRQLLKSEHFFDEEIIGALYKSPVDMLMDMYSEMNQRPVGDFDANEAWLLYDMGQFPLGPPNVAGWKGFRSWLSTTTMPKRWQFSDWDLWNNGADMIALARGMSDPNDPYKLAYDLADYLLAVPLPNHERQQLPNVLLGTIPYYEWNIELPGAEWRILNLVMHIRRLPEYQHL